MCLKLMRFVLHEAYISNIYSLENYINYIQDISASNILEIYLKIWCNINHEAIWIENIKILKRD